MMNDESNRAFSLAEVREFKEWCRGAQLEIECCQNSVVYSQGPWEIENNLDEAWEYLGRCIGWALEYEEMLKDLE